MDIGEKEICKKIGMVDSGGDGPITSSSASWFSSRDAYGPVRALKSAARRGKRAVRSRSGRSSHSSRRGELCGSPAANISIAPVLDLDRHLSTDN